MPDPSHRDVVLTGAGRRGQCLPQSGEMRVGDHARGVKPSRWKLRCGEGSPQPLPLPCSLCLQQGLVQRGAELLLRRPKSCQPGVHPSVGTSVFTYSRGKKGPQCVLVFRGDSPLPTHLLLQPREQDALTLTYTFGAWKPQPRQRRVHRGRVGGGATEAGRAGVCQQAHCGPAWGCGFLPSHPYPWGGRQMG